MTCHPRIASRSFPWRAVTERGPTPAIRHATRIRTDNLRAGTHTWLLPGRYSYSADQIAYARELPTRSVTFTGCGDRVLPPFCRISPFIGIH